MKHLSDWRAAAACVRRLRHGVTVPHGQSSNPADRPDIWCGNSGTIAAEGAERILIPP